MTLDFLRIIEQVRDHAMFLVDLHGGIASWNEGVRKILGWEASDWIGQSVEVAFTDDDQRAGVPADEMRAASQTGRADDDRWMRHKSGAHFFALGAMTRIDDAAGRPAAYLKVLSDYTGSRLAQEGRERLLASERTARREAENQAASLTAAIDAMPDAVCFCTPDGVITRSNAHVALLFGLADRDAMPRTMDDAAHAFRLRRERDGEPIDVHELPFARALQGHTAEIELWATRLDDGRDRFVRTTAAPVVVDHGEIVGIVAVTTDHTARWHAHEQERELARLALMLREREAQFRAVVQGVRNYAIFTVDVRGVISSWQAGAALLKGYSADEAIGMPFERLFTAADRAAGQPQREMETAARTGEYKGEGLRVRRDGSSFEAAVVLTALRGPKGQLLGYLKLTQDITERKREERERETMLREAHVARTEAERANRSKDEFLATISHELRTPLSAILGWTRVLERGASDPGTLSQGLSAISRNARVQVQLIEDLLDMNRIESGLLRLDVQQVELGHVVSAAIDAVLPVANAKGVAVRFTRDRSSAVVSGDSGRLQQIVGNLLDNAVKFTSSGGTVTVSLVQAKQAVEIAVADTGQGIEPAFVPHVFERFQQQDSTSTRRHGGLGIGLAIVRELVRLHGGSERAESAGIGHGSCFTITLPALEASDASAGTGEHAAGAWKDSHAPLSRIDGVTVLVIDDEPDVRATAEHLLRAAGAQVFAASNAIDGLALLRRHRPHVVLSDIAMPGHDGYELLRWVRELPDPQVRGTPAAAFTAYAQPEDRRRALAAGYQMHLVKPVPPDVLLDAVATLAVGRGSVK
jgi:PAS domain S-box-containing protein